MTLKDYLKNRSVEAFANEIGANLSTVYRWLKGDTRPTAERMARIKELTKGKVTANDFYG